MWSRLRRLVERDNTQHGETRARKKEAGPRSHWKTWRNLWCWERHGTTREAPSQLSTFTEQEQEQVQEMKKLEKLTIRLHDMECERNELRGILANYTNKDLNNRLNFELEMLEMEHKQVMSALQKLPMEISDALDKCKGLIEETEYFSYLHGRFLRECNPLKKSVRVLRIQNTQLWKEQIELQKTCEEVKKLLKEAHEKICDPCAEQQQEQENLEERLKDLLKQKELVTQQRDLAEKLQHHFSVSEMRSENLHHKLEHVTAQDESLLQTELLQQEQEVSQASEPPLHSNPCNHGIHGDWGLLTLASSLGQIGELAQVVKMRESGGITNPATTQVQNNGYKSSHPNTLFIYELQEHVKSPDLQIRAAGSP
ncbi:disks large homolog 5-like [Peromyscus eremicus]|uniref:disks large homolog 5-like n=1 Tax=Peromyscus eremicus TaxID=42410 RepID=UPI0027DDE46F|nr:disks large homolog 5-like [Peromyscus eremicus]